MDCNLRCKYCSADYGHFGEKNATEIMPIEICEKAIDLFAKNLNPNIDSPLVGFVGGEPLLNYKLIQHTVKYIKDRVKNIRYVMNTNGTLLTKKMAKWFAENEVPIRFSVDGTQKLHDKNRVYINGSGSYNNSINGIKNYARYYKKGFITQAAINSNKYFLQAVQNLWKLGSSNVILNPIGESFFVKNKNYIKSNMQWRDYSNQIDKVNKTIIDNLIYKNKSNTIHSTFKYLEPLYLRNKKQLGCGVGRTIAITTNGDIYPCQGFIGIKNYIIGNVTTKINRQKMSDFGKLFKSYLNKCKNCNINNICSSSCIAMSIQYDELNKKIPTRFCFYEKRHLENSIINYEYIKKNKPELLDFLFKNN